MTWRRPRHYKDGRRAVIERLGYGDNWSRQRARALRAAGYMCHRCGYHGRRGKDNRWDVYVHHKRKIAWFADVRTGKVDYEAANDINNLEVLCDRCHKVADGHAQRRGFRTLK